MANNSKGGASINEFTWESLGNIKEGREDLGEEMPVLVYRLMQFTLLDVLTKEFGPEKANDYFRSAGFLAGSGFAKNMLDLTLDFSGFLAALTKTLSDSKIGILRMEAIDPDTGNLVLTVGQDLECSGLPDTNETVCNYDEGFISGILNAYTGIDYAVHETDCWASGDKVCRFIANAERK